MPTRETWPASKYGVVVSGSTRTGSPIASLSAASRSSPGTTLLTAAAGHAGRPSGVVRDANSKTSSRRRKRLRVLAGGELPVAVDDGVRPVAHEAAALDATESSDSPPIALTG